MIAFDLECSNGHQFEGWFNNLLSFEQQSNKKLVSCPICNSTRVKRVLSPIAVRSSAKEEETAPREAGSIDYHRLAREIVDYIHRSFEDVGTHFAREALKIHYGVGEKRNIRGSATSEEEKMLKQEKIDFFKLPLPKSEGKKKN
ncbi:MAG: DUF1178 family protein [Desulfobacteraceae bacterium]|nr:MAG: DUF1178 family protein [Desulfobacteraceae bacterium]